VDPERVLLLQQLRPQETGIAIEDVAAAALVFERAVATGRGQGFDFGAP
jgi:hypothetical protein